MVGAKTGRSVKAMRCHHCKVAVLHGLDDDLCALEATVDHQPLSAHGEALARLQGRWTYELRQTLKGSAYLVRRDAWAIRSRRPGLRWMGGISGDIVAEHRCHAQPLPTITSVLTHALHVSLDPDAPAPF